MAIVGAGPAGLMAGYCLAKRGYNVTIFEALDVPGGALAACIPEYRLPRDRLEADIQNIKNQGVKIETGTRIGKDLSFDQLRREHRAVFIATGAHKSKRLGVPNEEAEGVWDAMEFLKDANLGKQVAAGKRVGIIGGGNSAVDAARVAVRLKGCQQVTVIYRRTRAEMPAFEEEIEAAVEEGIQMQFLTAPQRVLAKHGRVAGVECLRMELGQPDESGRRRPLPIEGSEFVIDLDTLIVAIGEEPDLSYLADGHGVEVSRWGTAVVSGESLVTNVEGVFAGGDVVTGPDTVIQAMWSGKLAAEMIDKHIRGQSLERHYEFIRPSKYVPAVELTEEEIEEAQRPVIPCLAIDQRAGNFAEVDLCLTEEMAIKEARRCLRCDLETEDAKAALAQQQAEGG